METTTKVTIALSDTAVRQSVFSALHSANILTAKAALSNIKANPDALDKEAIEGIALYSISKDKRLFHYGKQLLLAGYDIFNDDSLTKYADGLLSAFNKLRNEKAHDPASLIEILEQNRRMGRLADAMRRKFLRRVAASHVNLPE